MKQGFSLIELSIVLVILGLLTGGILTGQSLIRASELRAVTTEYQRYQTAVHTFRDKYFAMPGDMANATAFWGKDNTNCSGDTGTAATPGTCNGNGDGAMDISATAGTTAEIFQAWKQLALANMVEGSYSGLSGPGNDAIVGTNSPSSKMSNSGWSFVNFANAPGDVSTYAYDYGNSMVFGGTYSTNIPIAPVLKPEEAWNIDTKMDDGKPGTGKIFAHDFYHFGSANSCTTSTSGTDYTGSYRLDNSSVACSFYFPQAL